MIPPALSCLTACTIAACCIAVQCSNCLWRKNDKRVAVGIFTELTVVCMSRDSQEVPQRSLSRVSITSGGSSGASVYHDAQEDLPDECSDATSGERVSLSPCHCPLPCSLRAIVNPLPAILQAADALISHQPEDLPRNVHAPELDVVGCGFLQYRSGLSFPFSLLRR